MNGSSFQMPPQASTIAGDVDALYYFIFWGSTFFFLLITGLSLFFVLRYRRRDGEKMKKRAYHNTPLELTWTIVPLILVLAVFVWGFKGFMEMSVAPGGSQDYYVTGSKWLWEIKHPNGYTAINEMTVPVNQPVRVILRSNDVLHSFFVPAFRVKGDAIPNRYNTIWFEATYADSFQIYCTEYCGTGHSEMLAKVNVLGEEDWITWEREAGKRPDDVSPEEWGEKLYANKACITCHSIDGSEKTGPTFAGLFGKQEQLSDGTSVLVDEDYIRTSILNPNAQVVAGYDGVMPTYAGTMSDDDIASLIAFIKTLN